MSTFIERMAARHLESSPFPRMHTVVPAGSHGNVTVRHLDLTPNDVLMPNLRAVRDGRLEQVCCPGRFAVLHIGDQVVVSDTPMERITNLEFYQQARGDVLVAGLGLGMVVHAIANKPEVRNVVVVEKNQDVIELVRPTLPKERVVIVTLDIHQYVEANRKVSKFDTIWFDIWPTISMEDTQEAARLIRRARRMLTPSGWIGAWAHDLRKREARRSW